MFTFFLSMNRLWKTKKSIQTNFYRVTIYPNSTINCRW